MSAYLEPRFSGPVCGQRDPAPARGDVDSVVPLGSHAGLGRRIARLLDRTSRMPADGLILLAGVLDVHAIS